jgi:hypothetical protein
MVSAGVRAFFSQPTGCVKRVGVLPRYPKRYTIRNICLRFGRLFLFFSLLILIYVFYSENSSGSTLVQFHSLAVLQHCYSNCNTWSRTSPDDRNRVRCWLWVEKSSLSLILTISILILDRFIQKGCLGRQWILRLQHSHEAHIHICCGDEVLLGHGGHIGRRRCMGSGSEHSHRRPVRIYHRNVPGGLHAHRDCPNLRRPPLQQPRHVTSPAADGVHRLPGQSWGPFACFLGGSRAAGGRPRQLGPRRRWSRRTHGRTCCCA